ncbi:WXG100-like domain-containing protein [Saccharopolyspora soli]|uniref:WXG100-like domain-containing protein n=1 Tax=Saccharopolyspora soli TaxID=2926618 RepID=UPI0024130CE9|nr:hypothetical protein [Saccharopolyspora soli]
MSNPLVARQEQNPDGPGPLTAGTGDAGWGTGIGIAESINDVTSLNDGSSWVEAGLAYGGLAMEVVSMAVDPIGTLLSYGLSWLIEHVEPLKEALDWFAGDPDGVKAYGETWANVAKAVGEAATQYNDAVKADTAHWTGAAGDAYRKHAAEKGEALSGASELADTISTVVTIMGEVVSFVREFVRDLVADCISRLITYALEALAPPVVSLAWVVPQAVAFIAKTVSKIADVVTKLVKTISNVAPKLAKLVEVFGDVMKALGKLGKKAADGVGTGASKIGNVAEKFDVAGKLSDKVAEKAWQKFDDTFGTDVVGKHDAKIGGPDAPGSGSGAGSGSSGDSSSGGAGSGSSGDGSGAGPSGSGAGSGSGSAGGGSGSASSSSASGSGAADSPSSAPGSSSSAGGPGSDSPRGGTDSGSAAPESERAADVTSGSADVPRSSSSVDSGASGPGANVASASDGSPGLGGGSAGGSSSGGSVSDGSPSGGSVSGGGGPSGAPASAGSAAPQGPDVPNRPASTSSASVDAPARPETGVAPPAPGAPSPRPDQPASGAVGGGATGVPMGGAPPSSRGGGRPGSGGWTGAPGSPGAAGRSIPAGRSPEAPRPRGPEGAGRPASPARRGPAQPDAPHRPGGPARPAGAATGGPGRPGGPDGPARPGGLARPDVPPRPNNPAPRPEGPSGSSRRSPDGSVRNGRTDAGPGAPRQRQPEAPASPNDPAGPRPQATPQGMRPHADAPHAALRVDGPARPDVPRTTPPASHADRHEFAPVRHDSFTHVKGEGVQHWGPGWQQRMAEDARIRAESLGYHQKPESPSTPDPEAPQRCTPESMAAEQPPENPTLHHRNVGVPAQPPKLSDDLREKLGDYYRNIKPSPAGLSMLGNSAGPSFKPHMNRMPTPSVDPKRFTVEVHGSPTGVRLGDKDLNAKELAEIIRNSPGYTPGEPIRLLSCRTGADLPDGSPNFAQQLSKELGVEVLAPNTDAWVDNYGNLYASKDRASFDPGASGTPQPSFDEPGQWTSFRPNGTGATHESPFPPGHEPTWDRGGVHADAAQRRGFEQPPKEFQPPGGPAWSGWHSRPDAYGTQIQGHLSPTGEFVPHGSYDAFGKWTPHGQVDNVGRWVPGHPDANGNLVPNGHYDRNGAWIPHGRTDEFNRWIPVHLDSAGYHDLGRFNSQTHQWEPLGHVDPKTNHFVSDAPVTPPAFHQTPQHGQTPQPTAAQTEYAPHQQPGQHPPTAQQAPHQLPMQQQPAAQAPQHPNYQHPAAPHAGQQPQQPAAPQSHLPSGWQQPQQSASPHAGQQPQGIHQQPAAGRQPPRLPMEQPHAAPRSRPASSDQHAPAPQRSAMGTPQPPPTRQTPSTPQQPAPPSARPLGPPPVDVRGMPRQAPTGPSPSAPPPVEVSGPRQAPAAPRQTVPPVDVSGPRLDSPPNRGNTPTADVSGPPQTPSSQQGDLDAEAGGRSPSDSTNPAPQWREADGGSPFDAADPRPDSSSSGQSDADASTQDVDGESSHHDPEPSDHDVDSDEHDRPSLTTELASGDEPYFAPDYVANPDFRATEQDAMHMQHMYPPGEWKKDIHGFRAIVDSHPDLKAIGFDQAMGVRGYTAWHSYGPINQALREGDVDALRRFDGHIRCAVSALNQLPRVELPDNQVFHRVMMGGDIDKIVGQYAEGDVTIEHGFTSVSQGEPLLEPGKGTEVHMEIEGHSFRDVSFFAKKASENEAIAPPGIALLCTEKRYDEELGCWKLKFEEVEVPRNPDGSLTQRPKVLTTPEESAIAAKIDMMTAFG